MIYWLCCMWQGNCPELFPLDHSAGVMCMTNVELFALVIAVASLALTIYFGMKR